MSADIEGVTIPVETLVALMQSCALEAFGAGGLWQDLGDDEAAREHFEDDMTAVAVALRAIKAQAPLALEDALRVVACSGGDIAAASFRYFGADDLADYLDLCYVALIEGGS